MRSNYILLVSNLTYISSFEHEVDEKYYKNGTKYFIFFLKIRKAIPVFQFMFSRYLEIHFLHKSFGIITKLSFTFYVVENLTTVERLPKSYLKLENRKRIK